jgi:glycosyltransferase involved in cell wall biosynthesis
MNSEIFFSYIIPTIGRASLETAVKSVLKQDFSRVDYEVIVVNDSDIPLPQTNWLNSPRVRILHTYKSERSFARNSGAAVAKGKYLAFLDDDDWILPGALESFWNLARACYALGQNTLLANKTTACGSESPEKVLP